ncbi:MAG: formimidoylglutamate deiminase [Deltaproteobacteria bacterium]|nr:formimidoylglutamate deiminase [Deltaproteobacteria bacterium]
MSLPHVVVKPDGSIEPRDDGVVHHLLLPGLVNAHSHAFQRALRGRVEARSLDHPADDFWGWREAMYADANAVSVDDVRRLATWAYLDMVRAGVVAVGEFHYLHHDVDGRPYADPLALSRAVVEAAATVGLHITLLETAYARAGAGRAATIGQRRFTFENVTAFLAHVDDARSLRSPLCSVGVALHSVRACPRDWIEAVAGYAVDHALPLHVHACEQTREVAECRAEHGLTPIALLHACGALTERTTLVHATHLDDDDVALIAASKATVCLTPSTERNLGDGLCRTGDLHAAGVPLCVGSDSHARIDLIDELRSLEDHERLRTQKRCVLTRPGQRLAEVLVPAGTINGARSLGIELGKSSVAVAMPLEGHGGGDAVGVDAFFVGGNSDDVEVVHNIAGDSIFDDVDLDRLARNVKIETAAASVLWRLQGRS